MVDVLSPAKHESLTHISERHGRSREFFVEGETTTRYIRSLRDTIERLERENTECRSTINRLEDELAQSCPYLPSYFAEEILLHFCSIGTTELAQGKLFAAFPESSLDIEAALAELCAHKLLVVQTSRGEKNYVITTRGQDHCYGCRH